MNLMRNSVATDWQVPWGALALPTLVITGLCDRVFLDREVVDRLVAQLPEGRPVRRLGRGRTPAAAGAAREACGEPGPLRSRGGRVKIATRWAYPAVMIGVLGHASSEFFAKLSGVAGPEASVWRYLLGGFGLVLWALLYRDSRDLLAPLRTEGPRIVLLAFFGVTLTYLAFHWALDYASVIQVATMTTTIPIFVALANWIINGQRPGTVKIVTGLMAIFGVALLLTDGALDTLAGTGQSIWGVLLATACAAMGSFYAVMVKPVMARHGGLRIIALTMMLGGIGLWLLVGGAWGVWVNPLTLPERTPLAMWSLLVLALWNTTITQLMWFGGLSAAPDITRASYLFFLKPVIAAALAILILGSEPSLLQILAIIVVTGSVFVEMFWSKIERRL